MLLEEEVKGLSLCQNSLKKVFIIISHLCLTFQRIRFFFFTDGESA